MLSNSILDVIVIGGGHAGLSMSYYLSKYNLKHVIFERGKIGESWRSQRWDSFGMNTANKINLLPGMEKGFPDPDGFCTAEEFARFLEEYAKRQELPVQEQCKVIAVQKKPNSTLFSVTVSERGSIGQYWAKQVVVASGSLNEKNVPAFSTNVASNILQLHISEYRNKSTLPEGAVLVVGSADSGTQVAEDLIDGGKVVYLSTSKVVRIPRKYRGKDIVDWLVTIGFFDVSSKEVAYDPKEEVLRQPQITGLGIRGKTLSFQSLAKRGGIILGSMIDAERDCILLKPNAAENVRFADESSRMVKNMIDEHIIQKQLASPFPEIDDEDSPDELAACANEATMLNLKENHITAIIWATGFGADFRYLKLPIFNHEGEVKHHNGIAEIEGLYFIGLPWLRTRKSGIIFGAKEDAEYLIQKIRTYQQV